MAVETQRATAGSFGVAPLWRNVFWATAATLGVSGALAAIVSGVSAFLVYQYARARGTWGTDEPPAGVAEEVTFASAEDDVNISGWFFASLQGHAAPSIVLCHGVWTGRRECLPLALKFHQAGYNVLCFDFRAHGLSGGRYTSVGHHETNDVIGAVEYLAQRPEVDPERIGVIGFSMGAAATIQAAARCSFQLVTRLPHAPVAGIAMRWAKWIVHVDASQMRPIDVIGRISPRPILITHGVVDEIVPIRHAY